jgi:hypothetical protein
VIAKHPPAEQGQPRAVLFVASTRMQLAAIIIVSTCVRFVLARGASIPWLMPDELVYAGLGRQLAEGQVTSSRWGVGPH